LGILFELHESVLGLTNKGANPEEPIRVFGEGGKEKAMSVSAEQFLSRKERLLISAIRLLDEGGLAAVTTREMAKREGISEPAVYRHFNGKAEILMAILEQFGAFDSNMENTVHENGMQPLDAIRHVCLAYAGYYSGYPEIANVMFSLDLWKYSPQVAARFEEILLARHRLMRSLVDASVRQGLLPEGTKAVVLADLLANLVMSVTRQWRLEGETHSLVERMQDMLDMILPTTSDANNPSRTTGGNLP
jgi:TetR/AcrR family transcriptional regulator, fatty acid metabolism regulator protein